MADQETSPTLSTTQVNTTTLSPGAQSAEALYPPEGPNPPGTTPDSVHQMEKEERATSGHPDSGSGIEGEELVWEARYSMRNFLGRVIFRVVLTVAWIGLALYTWGFEHANLQIPTIAAGVGVLVLWAILSYRMMLARYGHHYRLTTRRLFVSTGLMQRRRDQLELLRIEDVFTKQSLFERWLGLGTVVVLSSERTLPTAYLTGVDDPKRVMDLIWHYARKERDERSVKVQSI